MYRTWIRFYKTRAGVVGRCSQHYKPDCSTCISFTCSTSIFVHIVCRCVTIAYKIRTKMYAEHMNQICRIEKNIENAHTKCTKMDAEHVNEMHVEQLSSQGTEQLPISYIFLYISTYFVVLFQVLFSGQLALASVHTFTSFQRFLFFLSH